MIILCSLEFFQVEASSRFQFGKQKEITMNTTMAFLWR